jgi:hypothetical protein
MIALSIAGAFIVSTFLFLSVAMLMAKWVQFLAKKFKL